MSACKKQSFVLAAIAAHDPDAVALVDDEGSLTYGQLLLAVNKAAMQLSSGCVLGLDLDNGREWMIWDLAALKAGAVCVPLPAFFSFSQMVHVLQATAITHMVSRDGLQKTDLIQTGEEFPAGTAKITFTSGTTGNPKGVCLSRKGMEEVAQSLVQVLGAELADRHLSVLPLTILLENIAGVYATLLAGGTCYLYRLESVGMVNPFAPDFGKLLQVMTEDRISSAILVPELLRGLMQALFKNETSLPALEFLAVGGAKVSPTLIKMAREMGLPVYEGYGLSECASVVALNCPGDDYPGTVGKSLPHIDLEIENNEIVIKNPAFLGYIGAPHKGAFKTGDLGTMDENGFLSVSGRRKNVLITSYGRNISPEWVESLVLTRPEVLQVLVYGDGQDSIGALIVPSCADADIESVIINANQALPAYAHIKAFHVVPSFNAVDGTLTGNGRLRRSAILKKYQHLISQETNHEFLQSTG